MIQASIFDMDGLLVDTEQLWENAYIEVFKRHGIVITKEAISKNIGTGLRTSDEIEIWHDLFNWETPTKEQMADEVTAEVTSSLRKMSEPLPGVRQITELLRNHSIPMAIASSSPTEQIELIVKNLSLEKHIQHVHSGENEPQSKPDPAVYLSAAKSLGVNPASCLVFEDSLTGLTAAKAAGMKCIAVPRSHYDTAGYEIADLVVDSLEDVTWQVIEQLWT